MARAKARTDYVTVMVSKEGDWYLARAEGLGIFTEAPSLEDLKEKIREAVDLHLAEGEHEKYGLPPNPTIRLVYRLMSTWEPASVSHSLRAGTHR